MVSLRNAAAGAGVAEEEEEEEEEAEANTAQDTSPRCGFRCARFSRVISQSSHGLYCESRRYNNVFGRGSSWMTRNLSDRKTSAATSVSSLIRGGGNRKLCCAVHSATRRSSSVLYFCCLNTDIILDMNDGEDEDDEDDGERSIDRCMMCQIFRNRIQFYIIANKNIIFLLFF